MRDNFVADRFHTKKLCSRLFFKQSANLVGKRPFFVLESPLRGLGATYDAYFILIGKRGRNRETEDREQKRDLA